MHHSWVWLGVVIQRVLCGGTSLLHTVRRLFLARQDGLLDWGKLLVHVRLSVCCVTLGAHSVSLSVPSVCVCESISVSGRVVCGCLMTKTAL